MKPTVILLSGFKRAGKDFIAQALQDHIKKESYILSFAEPLKDIICETIEISHEELDYYKNNEISLYGYDDNTPFYDADPTGQYAYHTNYRSMLQRFGSEAMKKWFGDSVWADLMLTRLHKDNLYIIPDWRFNIEYDVLKEHCNLITVRINDDNLSSDGHSSEEEILDFRFDYVVDNTIKDGSIPSPILGIAEKLNKE